MKKIVRVTNWDATSVIKEEQVINKTHWLIKSMDECFTMMGLTATFTPLEVWSGNAKYVEISIEGYEGTIKFVSNGMGFYKNDTSFIWYINTEKMELVGCASTTVKAGNCLRIGHYSNTYSENKYKRYGPLFVIKLDGNKLKGYGIVRAICEDPNSAKTSYLFTQIGVPLADCENVTTVTLGVDYEDWRCRMPILLGQDYYGAEEFLHFEGDYLEDVYLTEKYYNVPMKDTERSLYVYDGKAFLVDDLDDIGTIETTV